MSSVCLRLVCIIPVTLAIFLNTMVCYWMAKPTEGISIARPDLLPALLAAVSVLLFVSDQAPPVAFVAGVLDPLIEADHLRLRDIEKLAIGGAGTFDGIVLSGIVAAYLA